MLANEDLLGLSEAREVFGPDRFGRLLTRGGVRLWIERGLRAPNGSVVKLEAAMVSGRWVTTREAVARFVARVSGRAPAPEPALTTDH